eukprot:359321-Chlamydomonas_euryale.AAC.6
MAVAACIWPRPPGLFQGHARQAHRLSGAANGRDLALQPSAFDSPAVLEPQHARRRDSGRGSASQPASLRPPWPPPVDPTQVLHSSTLSAAASASAGDWLEAAQVGSRT